MTRKDAVDQERAPLQLAPVFGLQMMEKKKQQRKANVTIEKPDLIFGDWGNFPRTSLSIKMFLFPMDPITF